MVSALKQRVIRWWQRLKELLAFRQRSGDGSGSGESQAGSGSPSTAAGQQMAGQGGLHDDGPVESATYLVQDQKGDLDTHFDWDSAYQQWQKDTHQQGKIIHLPTGKDVTPDKQSWLDKLLQMLGWHDPAAEPEVDGPERKPEPDNTQPMNQAQLQQIQQLARASGRNRLTTRHQLNQELLHRLIAEVDRLDLPVFQLARKRRAESVKLVSIKKRRQKINRREIRVTEEQTVQTTHATLRPSTVFEDEMEIGRMREARDMTRAVRKGAFGYPTEVLARRMVNREIPVRYYLALEDEVEETVQAVTKTVIVDEPVIEEWVEQQEVSTGPQNQLLYILSDASGSTTGVISHLEAAVAIAIVGRNLDNNSRYFWQSFTSELGPRFSAETPAEKRRLVGQIVANSSSDGGTEIARALEEAVQQIRLAANPDDQPEILLLTDGADHLTSEQIYQIIGEDITLHTVAAGMGNPWLQDVSSTYIQLYADADGDVMVLSYPR